MKTDWKCEAVLFDMDGVLLDTEPLYTIAYDRVLAPFGAHLDKTTKLEIMGGQAIQSATHVLKKLNIPMTPEEFLEKRRPILQELLACAPAVRGAEDFVRRLAVRGLPLAIATSTKKKLFALKTRKYPWFSLFREIVCGDDPQVENPKPAPDIFLTAARRLGVAPERCAIFEDSPKGVRAASATGARVFALLREETDLSRYTEAYQVISNFEQAEI